MTTVLFSCSLDGDIDMAFDVMQLIDVNDPDLVLFVGEALVGNDAVDQLVKFNRALSEHVHASAARTGQPHTVDGIVLTKFDTVDDKVRLRLVLAISADSDSNSAAECTSLGAIHSRPGDWLHVAFYKLEA